MNQDLQELWLEHERVLLAALSELGEALGPVTTEEIHEYIDANEFMLAFEAIEAHLSELAVPLTKAQESAVATLTQRFDRYRD
jgi:hypothetical protein